MTTTTLYIILDYREAEICSVYICQDKQNAICDECNRVQAEGNGREDYQVLSYNVNFLIENGDILYVKRNFNPSDEEYEEYSLDNFIFSKTREEEDYRSMEVGKTCRYLNPEIW